MIDKKRIVSSRMHITYLILTHSNLNHLRLLINALDSDDSTFVVHIDKKCKEDFSFLYDYTNVKILEDRRDVSWGGFSIIETLLYSLQETIKIGSDRIILLSGTDYPIKTPEYIHHFLLENKDTDFIEGYPFPSPQCHWLEGGRRRLECYALDLGHRNIATIEPKKINIGNIRQLGKVLLKAPNKILKALNMLLRFSPRRHPEYLQSFRGEMWWCLRRSTIQLVLNYIKKNPQYLEYHKSTCIPDEIFMSTLVHNLIPSNQITNNSLRLINWGSGIAGNSPYDITQDDIPLIETSLKNPIMLFGRKITDNKVITYINNALKNE